MADRQTARVKRAQREVDAFNERHPVGTPVRYWLGLREGPGSTSRTRSEAALMSDHASVWIEGVAGSVALSHVEVIEAKPDDGDVQGLVDQLVEERLEEIGPSGNGVAKLFVHSDGRAIEVITRRSDRPSILQRYAEVTAELEEARVAVAEHEKNVGAAIVQRDEARTGLAELVEALFLDDRPRLAAIEKARALVKQWGLAR